MEGHSLIFINHKNKNNNMYTTRIAYFVLAVKKVCITYLRYYSIISLAGKKGAKKFTSKEKLKQLMSLVGVKDRPKIVDLTRKIGTAETLTESKINCSTSNGSKTQNGIFN